MIENNRNIFNPPPQADPPREFCKHCGAGVGVHRRKGEGTCPDCYPLVEQFADYCKEHPELRFWQALLNWSEVPFIAITSHPPMFIYAETRVVGMPSERVEVQDPYNWRKKNEF